jgi:hypothetical protein
MNLNLKPHPLVAHWIPGITLCSIILFSVFNWNYKCLIISIAPSTQGLAFSVFLLTIVSFIIGEALDAFRNSIIEGCLDKKKKNKIKWDFFCMGEKDEINNIDEWYFTWYAFSVNMCSAILFGSLVSLSLFFAQVSYINIKWPFWSIIIFMIMIFLFGLFCFDAKNLRKEIKVSIDRLYHRKKMSVILGNNEKK